MLTKRGCAVFVRILWISDFPNPIEYPLNAADNISRAKVKLNTNFVSNLSNLAIQFIVHSMDYAVLFVIYHFWL